MRLVERYGVTGTDIYEVGPGVFQFSFGGGNQLQVPTAARARSIIDQVGRNARNYNSDSDLGRAINSGVFGSGWRLVEGTTKGSTYAAPGVGTRAAAGITASYAGQLIPTARTTVPALSRAPVPATVTAPALRGSTATGRSKPRGLTLAAGAGLLAGLTTLLWPSKSRRRR